MNAITSSTPATRVLNIAAYKFVQLDALERRRRELLQRCRSLKLRGTILLSPEGINLFLAGPPDNVAELLEHLRADPAFSDLETKDSYSDSQPFRRMLVRLKKEIIAFGVDSVRPVERTSPKLPPEELRAWLDAGRPVRLLDVRNDYEFDLGTFDGAEQLNIGNFRDFPQAIKQLPEAAKREPLVMFCTGGIRCEKAGPLLEQEGFEQVYQLDGGILKYFEQCGGQHYHGSCFVFDGRVALGPDLQPTGNVLCFACQAVLTAEDVQSEKFLLGQWCPRCYQPPAERLAPQRLEREATIRAWAETQPGSTAYDNVRQIFVPRRLAGLSLLDFLTAWHVTTPRETWLAALKDGQITYAGQATWAEQIVREGQAFEQRLPGTIEPKINPDITLLYEDSSLVAVHKPAPLPVHPSGRYSRNSLSSLMAPAYPRQKLRVAHRLDANTSGVVLLCRTYQSARIVQPQFSNGQVEKSYVARVHGHPSWESTYCEIPIGASPQAKGARRVECEAPVAAATRLRVIEQLPDGTSLVEAEPLTGRTHQIRIHLWQLGHAVVGDPLYLPQRALGSARTLSLGDPPMCLHAARLAVQHPESGEKISFTADLPAWAQPN